LQSKVLAEPAFVGREQELAELEHHLALAMGRIGVTVFVSGEAGSGKTRLTREFLNAAKKKGIAVIAGWCLSDAQVPYFPFIEAFNAYFATFPEEEQPVSPQQLGAQLGLRGTVQVESEERGITTWLTEPRPVKKPGKPEALSPQIWKDQAFAAVAKTLHSISVQEPIVLFIEDIHWADSASLALLHYVARAINNSERILVLATFRSEGLTADAEGRPHPLTEVLRMMRREDLFTEIKLPSLNQASISKIAESMIGGSLQSQLAEKLTTESRGNPLFVVESLRMLSERKSLIQENSQWRLAVDELSIPSKVRDIILQRLSVLKYAQRRVLVAASVIGEKFSAELLSAVLGQDSLEVLETLDIIAQSTSLVRADEGFYRFDHARSRETLYEELALPLKRGYHARIAEKLEGTKGEALPLSDLAYHYAQAGNKEKAIKYALEAGKDALAKFSNSQAISHFTYVLQALGEEPQHAEQRAVALEGLGDAFYANSMFKDATRIFEDLADTVASDVVRLRAFRKAMEAVFQYGDAPHLMELVKKAEPYAAADRLENARILVSRGRAFTIQGMFLRGMEDEGAALRVFEEEYALWDVAWALLGQTMLADYTAAESVAKEGIANCMRSIALFGELADFRWQMEAYFVADMTFSLCLLEHEALELIAKIEEIDERMKMNDYLRLCRANVQSARSLWGIGDFDKSLAFTLKALSLAEKTDSDTAHAMVYSDLTIEYALLGDAKRSEEYFDKLAKLPPEILNHVWVQIEFARAVFFAAKNQWEESNRIFEETLELFNRVHPPFVLRLKLLYSWALKKQGRFEEAEILRQDVQRGSREAEERFAHASVQASLMVRRQVAVGREFEIRLDLVNAGKKPALLVEVRNVFSDDFKVISSPPWCSIQNGAIRMKNKEIGAFQVDTAKLALKCLKAGTFTLNPQAIYVDDLGETKTCNLRPITIAANLPAPKERVAGKISSGTPDLDRLLLGGIPENYAIVLDAPSSDERSLLIKRFLEAGIEAGEKTFYVTVETGNAKALAEKHPSEFYLLVCNPQADSMIQNMPNVHKLKGVENLTDIDIALTKAVRTLKPTAADPKRICIEIVSDVLLQHHAVATRRWLNELLPTLKSKGFTILAVVDPSMHPSEELQAILGVFDGEIRVSEKETPEGTKRTLKIRKLTNQRYSDKEIALNKEALSD
jgi:KaiC/GvpD/RAD55 family RecA-like ATPase/tetratricopeptide (TPR) repeat protein